MTRVRGLDDRWVPTAARRLPRRFASAAATLGSVPSATSSAATTGPLEQKASNDGVGAAAR